jgi:hypothetical protein
MPIGRDLCGTASGYRLGTAEKALGRGHVSSRTEHGIDELPVPVNGSIQITPPAIDLPIGLILSAKSGGKSESGKARAACFLLLHSLPPVHDSLDIHRCGCDRMLQTGFDQTTVARAA